LTLLVGVPLGGQAASPQCAFTAQGGRLAVRAASLRTAEQNPDHQIFAIDIDHHAMQEDSRPIEPDFPDKSWERSQLGLNAVEITILPTQYADSLLGKGLLDIMT
jgi:hypothetical protein